MPNTNILKNREAFNRALENAMWKLQRSSEFSATMPQIVGLDTRNLNDLAILLIDLNEVPTESREAYFDAELKKLADAFYTLDPNTGRPYPHLIKPVIEKTFKKIALNTNIDWDNEAQIENVICTIKASQAVATLAYDFKNEFLELYPTVEDKARTDAISGFAYLVYNEVGTVMLQKDIDFPYEFMVGVRHFDHFSFAVEHEVANEVFKADMKGGAEIAIDPTNNELTKKCFFKTPFTASCRDGAIEYSDEEYLVDYMGMLGLTYNKTSVEQLMVSRVKSGSGEEFNEHDLVSINGRSVHDIIKEKVANGASRDQATVEAAKMFRDALTDGESVVNLMRVSFNKQGEVSFRYQDVKLDLDKLNAAYRKEHYGFFRRFLDKIGFWKIPARFASNKVRDARVADAKKNTQYQEALQATENKFIDTYNQIAPTKDEREMLKFIPKITRADDNKQVGERAVDNQVAREPFNVDLAEEKTVVSVPLKESDEKVISHEPPVK